MTDNRSLCIGIMSGTSGDGVDIAIVDIGGMPPDLSIDVVHFETVPFLPEVRTEIFKLFDYQKATLLDVSRMNFVLGHVFADAVEQTVLNANLEMDDILLISSHGQTVYHGPDAELVCGVSTPSLLQLGEAAVIAERTGRPVVADFRVRDMAAGGQGAPLVPFFDSLLYSSPSEGTIAANIGGIANITVLPATETVGEVIAFDTGPGNMIVDGLVHKATRGAMTYDQDGAMAQRGQVDEALLQHWMSMEYFRRKPPKSTGRELFGDQVVEQWWEEGNKSGLSPESIVATATEFTVRSFCQAISNFVLPNHSISRLIVGGGGAHNRTMMSKIQRRLPDIRILTQDETGIPGDAKESVAFAVLGYERWHGRPNNLASATGAVHSVCMGKVTL